MRVHLDILRGRSAPQAITVEAASVGAARLAYEQQGFTVLSAKAARSALAIQVPLAPSRPAASAGELTLFIEQMSALLNAGLSVIEVLETLQKGAETKWVPIITGLASRLKEGYSLSQALADHPLFPPLLVALVHSAELTSDLPQALGRYLEHEKRAQQVRHQLISVALYPLLLMMVGGAVMLFLLLYVMPRFSRVFENMRDLPWSAQAMVNWSHALKMHGPEMALGVGGVAVLGASLLMVPRYRARLTASVFKIPLVAKHVRTYFLARWYRTIGMLVQGGIPLPESLGLATMVLPMSLRQSGSAVEQAMRNGMPPSASFASNDMATPVAERLLKAGERSGDVGIMLTRAADFHDAEVTRKLENGMRLIEPLVMTFIGLGVGVIVVLMYLPIFELASAIQ